MKIVILLFICSVLITCKGKEKEVPDERSLVRDSIMKTENVEIDFDSIFSIFRKRQKIYSIDFQTIDSNKVCISSSNSIFDIEKLDSLNYNIKLNFANNVCQINLHTMDSILVKNLISSIEGDILNNLNSYLFSKYIVVFKIYPNSFESIQLANDELEYTKLISGNGELIKILIDTTKVH